MQSVLQLAGWSHPLDPIPAELFKANFHCLSPETTIIIKCSETFPKAFPTTVVKNRLQIPP